MEGGWREDGERMEDGERGKREGGRRRRWRRGRRERNLTCCPVSVIIKASKLLPISQTPKILQKILKKVKKLLKKLK
jgi:hypothetical protein